MLDDGSEAGMWLTATNKSYDFAYTRDHTGTKGRFHHVTYALDTREDMLRAADIFLENGVFIETGPHKHAIQQTFFLYVYEPGGNRVEVANAGARLVLAPDWKPIPWTEAERKKGQAWGLQDHRIVPHPRHAGDSDAREAVSAEPMPVPDDDAIDADRALVAALAKGDASAAAAWLDDDFTWVDYNGRTLTAAAVMQSPPKPPLGDEAGVTPTVHRYGEVADHRGRARQSFCAAHLGQTRRRLAPARLSRGFAEFAGRPARPRPQGMGQSVQDHSLRTAQRRRARLPRLLAAAGTRGDASRRPRSGRSTWPTNSWWSAPRAGTPRPTARR